MYPILGRSWRGLVLSQNHLRLGILEALLTVSIISICVLIALVPRTYASPEAISQNYETNEKDISQGALLSLVSKGGTLVTLANSSSNASTLIGVANSKSLIELSGGNTSGVQVVVDGSTDVLVSDLNGQIDTGDKITTSPISGIGMKATSPSEVVGTAQADLSSVKTVTKYFAGTNGRSISAKVGLLPIGVNVNYYAAASAGGGISAYVPSFLQNVANAVAGRAVSPLRVLIGISILLLGFITIMIMLYTGIRSGVISIGRNPLAADALRSSLIDILLAAVGVLIVMGALTTAIIAG